MPRNAKILIRNGTTTPSAGDFDVGEPAWDRSNDRLFIKDGGGTMVQIGATRASAAGATSGTLTPNGTTSDLFVAEGLTGAVTLAAPSGTPANGQKLLIRLKDNGTARGITWTTSSGAYRAIGITLPTTTVISKVTYVGCVYNGTDLFWDAVATVTQA
jgi:hypothetical protein